MNSFCQNECFEDISKNYIKNYLTLQAPTLQNGQTQTIRRVLPTNCVSVFEHFVGLAYEGLIISISIFRLYHSLRRILDHGLKQSAFSPILHPWYFVEEVIFSSYY